MNTTINETYQYVSDSGLEEFEIFVLAEHDEAVWGFVCDDDDPDPMHGFAREYVTVPARCLSEPNSVTIEFSLSESDILALRKLQVPPTLRDKIINAVYFAEHS